MQTQIIEATVGTALWSTFLVGKLDTELGVKSRVDLGKPVIRHRDHLMVTDLGTQEGMLVGIDTYLRDVIRKHAIWASPLFVPFLNWLITQLKAGVTIGDLPSHVEIPWEQAGDSIRGEGPLGEFLTRCLRGNDPLVKETAREMWADRYGYLPPSPPTVENFLKWVGHVEDTVADDG